MERNLSHLTELEAPSVIMMIGVPGSGKSHIAQQVGKLLGIETLSSDSIREEISGNANDQTVSKEAWTLLYDRAQNAIGNKQTLIIDATHTHEKSRQRDIASYKRFGAKAVVGIHVSANINTVRYRNANRDRTVPDFVIDRMQANIDQAPASTKDGFTFVIRVDNDSTTNNVD